jgi:predicted Zn-dependent peptidase
MIDRKIAPSLNEVSQVQLVEPNVFRINESVSLFYLENQHSEGFKLDLYFDGGFRNSTRLLAKIANKSALSGTSTKTSNEIDNQISIYGGFVGQEFTSEDAAISILGQNQHFENITKTVLDAIANATIPERDLKQTLATEKQRFIVQQKKVSTQARRLFLSNLYKNTSQSKLTTENDFEKITQDQVLAFFNEHYKKGLLKVALIGNIPANQMTSLIRDLNSFAGKKVKHTKVELNSKSINAYNELTDKVQSAIRIGKPLFNRTHEDYPKFVLLNTLLGGYFGSRLMKTIREEKGLTYGIGSGIAQAIDHAYFFISTEVNKEKREEAIEAILDEIKILQTERISDEELEVVKNYSIGQLLKNSDGPFAQMDRFLSVEKFGMKMEYYNELLESFKSCTAGDIMLLANKHLKLDELSICSAG